MQTNNDKVGITRGVFVIYVALAISCCFVALSTSLPLLGRLVLATWLGVVGVTATAGLVVVWRQR